MTLTRSRIIVLLTAHDAISRVPPQERNDGPLRVMQHSAFQLGCARVRLVSRRRESFEARWCAPRWRRVAGRVAVWFVQGGVRVSVARGVRWLVVTRRECAPGAPRTLFFASGSGKIYNMGVAKYTTWKNIQPPNGQNIQPIRQFSLRRHSLVYLCTSTDNMVPSTR